MMYTIIAFVIGVAIGVVLKVDFMDQKIKKQNQMYNLLTKMNDSKLLSNYQYEKLVEAEVLGFDIPLDNEIEEKKQEKEQYLRTGKNLDARSPMGAHVKRKKLRSEFLEPTQPKKVIEDAK